KYKANKMGLKLVAFMIIYIVIGILSIKFIIYAVVTQLLIIESHLAYYNDPMVFVNLIRKFLWSYAMIYNPTLFVGWDPDLSCLCANNTPSFRNSEGLVIPERRVEDLV